MLLALCWQLLRHNLQRDWLLLKIKQDETLKKERKRQRKKETDKERVKEKEQKNERKDRRERKRREEWERKEKREGKNKRKGKKREKERERKEKKEKDKREGESERKRGRKKGRERGKEGKKLAQALCPGASQPCLPRCAVSVQLTPVAFLPGRGILWNVRFAGLVNTVLRHHALSHAFVTFCSWSLFPPTVSASQNSFNGSSWCRASGRHRLVAWPRPLADQPSPSFLLCALWLREHLAHCIPCSLSCPCLLSTLWELLRGRNPVKIPLAARFLHHVSAPWRVCNWANLICLADDWVCCACEETGPFDLWLYLCVVLSVFS